MYRETTVIICLFLNVNIPAGTPFVVLDKVVGISNMDLESEKSTTLYVGV